MINDAALENSARIVSGAASILVSKAGVIGAANVELTRQLTFYPKAMGMSALVIAIIALIPGIPALPFPSLAGVVTFLSFRSRTRNAKQEEKTKNNRNSLSPKRLFSSVN